MSFTTGSAGAASRDVVTVQGISGGTGLPVSNAGSGVSIRPTITISATPDYSVNDIVGGIVTLSSVVTAAGRAAELRSVTLTDATGAAPGLTLVFFRATPAAGTYTDNGAVSWGAGDLANICGIVEVAAGDWYTTGSKSVVTKADMGQVHVVTGTDLFLLIFADSIYNAAATTDLTADFGYERR